MGAGGISNNHVISLRVKSMRRYPLDIDPEQVVRWIIDEDRAAPSRFRILARRGAELQDIPLRKELRLGDEEREDLSEVDTIAMLEIAPAHASEGWLLTVVVEDEAGPRPLNGGASEEERQIEVDTFYSEFIRPGRGVANVFAEAADETAEARVEQLVTNIEQNRHGPAESRPAR
jgi:hypothetical protein